MTAEPMCAEIAAGAGISPGTTVAGARRILTDAFRAAVIDSPALDARLLVGHALGIGHAALVAAAQRELTATEAAHIAVLATRRLAREPVARIIGEKEFWGLRLRLGPAVLVPRPDTETVVEAALAVIDARGWRHRDLRIVDLGTGSGALLLALLSELPGALGIGTDIDRSALLVARDNAARLGFADRACFAACSFGAALGGPFDLVVCNPPYVATDDIAALDPEVRDHDPRAALDGGADGLAAYRALALDARRLTGPYGHLVVELGAGARRDVVAIFSAAGWAISAARVDLAGVARALHIHPPQSG